MVYRKSRYFLGFLLGVLLFSYSNFSRVVSADDTKKQVEIVTKTLGDTSWSYLAETSTQAGQKVQRPIATHGGGFTCLRQGQWRLLETFPHENTQLYHAYIFDSCANGIGLVDNGSCKGIMVVGHCVMVSPHHLATGLSSDQCKASSVLATALHADINSQPTDPTQPTVLQLSTSFTSDFKSLLGLGSCTSILDWQVISWTIQWPDDSVENLPGRGQQGLLATHALPPEVTMAPSARPAKVTAHVHVAGEAMDVNDHNQLITLRRDADVELTSIPSLGNGVPVYVFPVLTAGVRPISQDGDGSMPSRNASVPIVSRAVAIRGRLLDLYPSVKVTVAGAEYLDGRFMGNANSQIQSWAYLGNKTDAPSGTANRGTASQPVAVQYNHAEQLNPLGQPLDETVPISVDIVTTYPDGYVVRRTLQTSIKVTIYYPALAYAG